MSLFPLAPNLAGARRADAPKARTEDEATTLAGGPVFLAVEEFPESFETPDAAEAAVPFAIFFARAVCWPTAAICARSTTLSSSPLSGPMLKFGWRSR